MRKIWFRRALAVAATLATVVAIGFATPAGARSTTNAAAGVVEYVGVVKGVKPYVNGVPQADAYFIAISVNRSGDVVAYTCDGFGESASFNGAEQDGKVDLPSEEGGSQITATIAGPSAKGQLSIAGEEYAFTLKKAKTVGGLYTITVKQSDAGDVVVTGVSERGNKLKSVAKVGQQKFTITVTTANGSKRKLEATPLQPPADLLGFDGYRFVLLDNGKMGRGNTTVNAVQLPPLTPPAITTLQKITGTVIQFF